jgi:hypothetical protein
MSNACMPPYGGLRADSVIVDEIVDIVEIGRYEGFRFIESPPMPTLVSQPAEPKTKTKPSALLMALMNRGST